MKKKLARLHAALATVSQNRLYYRILSSFLVIVLLVMAVGIVSSLLSQRAQEKAFEEKVLQNQSASIQLCENYIRPAYELNTNMFNNDYIKQNLVAYSSATLPQRLNFIYVTSVIRSNKDILGSIIDSFFLYNDDRYVYDGNGVNDFDAFLTKYYDYSEPDISYFRSLLSRTTDMEVLPPTKVKKFYSGTEKTVLPIVRADYLGGLDTVMVTNLDLQNLHGFLERTLVYDNTEFVILTEDNRLILSSTDSFGSSVLKDSTADLSALQDGGGGWISVGGKRFWTSLVASGTYGWKYFYFTPSVNRNSDILTATVAICLTLVVIGVFFSFLFTNSLYSPIRNIREILENHQMPAATEKNSLFRELLLLQSHVGSLAQNYYTLLDTNNVGLDSVLLFYLTENKCVVDRKALLTLLHGQCGLKYPSCACAAVRFTFTDAFYEELDPDTAASVRKALGILINESDDSGICGYTFEAGEGVYLCAFSLRGPELHDALVRQFQKLLEVLRYDSRYYRVVIGLGSIAGDLSGLPDSCDAALTAMESCEGDGAKQFFDAADLKIGRRIFFPINSEKNLLYAAEAGEMDSLRENIGELSRVNAENRLSWRCSHRLLRRIYDTVHPKKSEEIPSIFDCTQVGYSVQEKFGVLTDLCQKDFLQSQNISAGEKRIVSAIRDYIGAEYEKDLSLQSISDQFSYNPKYVSKIFKESTGYNITDYVSFVRISKAKMLIVNTNMSIEDIQNAVGFVSRTTFNRIFKRSEGVPPIKYREIETYNRVLNKMEKESAAQENPPV